MADLAVGMCSKEAAMIIFFMDSHVACMLLVSIGKCWRLLASVLHKLGKSALE